MLDIVIDIAHNFKKFSGLRRPWKLASCNIVMNESSLLFLSNNILKETGKLTFPTYAGWQVINASGKRGCTKRIIEYTHFFISNCFISKAVLGKAKG